MADKGKILDHLKTLEGKMGRGALTRLVDEDILGHMEDLNRKGVSYASLAENLTESTGEPIKAMQIMFALKQYRKRHELPSVRTTSPSGKPRGRKPKNSVA